MLYNKDSNPYLNSSDSLVTDELNVIQDYKRFYKDQPNITEDPKAGQQELRALNTITPKMGKGGAFITSSIKKYNPGGEILPIPYATSGPDGSPFNASVFNQAIGSENSVGSFLDTSGNTFDMGDMGSNFGGFSPAGVATSAVSIGSSISEAKQLKREFNKDLDDSEAVDRKSLNETAIKQREAQGEAIGEAGGTAIGAIFGAPELGGKAGKFLGKLASKVKGKKFKNKVKSKYEKEQGEYLDFNTGMARQSEKRNNMSTEQSEQMKYLQDVGIAKYGGNFNGLVKGKRHEEGGVMMYKNGAPIAEVEGDEYVINNDILKDKPESKKKFNIQGTPVQIASALNSIKKYGVNSHPGGVVKQVS